MVCEIVNINNKKFFTMKVNIKPNEVVVKAGDSQHLNERGTVAGKLIL